MNSAWRSARARQKIIKGKRVVAHLNGGIALFAVLVFLYGQQFIERTVGAFDRRATDGLAPGQDAADEIWVLQFGRERFYFGERGIRRAQSSKQLADREAFLRRRVRHHAVVRFIRRREAFQALPFQQGAFAAPP